MRVEITRRHMLRAGVVAGAGAAIGVPQLLTSGGASAQQLAATAIPQFVTPLFILPAMPRSYVTSGYDQFSLAARPFRQQMLPHGLPSTPVFGIGSATNRLTFRAPAYTLEATVGRHTRVILSNELVDAAGDYVPSLLPVDPTLMWANPPGGTGGRDTMPTFKSTPGRYTGPVPFVMHLHGGHTFPDADGYPEAWYLPAARNIPAGYAKAGTFYDQYKEQAYDRAGVRWGAGSATYVFANDQRATNLWFHDHTLGMTRLNIRAGLLGMYMLRGGGSDLKRGALPGPAPGHGDRPGTRYYEIPLVIQDPTFNTDGTQFLPAVNTFSNGPYIPETDVPPIWNGVYFGNTITVNGNTWPNLNVEPRRYRFRVLNACASRPLTLKVVSRQRAAAPAETALPIWVIGSDGGFLPAPVELAGKTGLPMLPSERYDIIVDFTGLKPGTHLYLNNEGSAAAVGTTGSVMRFTVVPLRSKDGSVPPRHLKLPSLPGLRSATKTRRLSFSEQGSSFEVNQIVKYLAGTVDSGGIPIPLDWAAPVTEKPADGATEVWEVWNFSPEGAMAVSHVFHMHMVQFQVLNREPIGGGTVSAPYPWERGHKDSCASPTGLVTRVKATFDHKGRFVWHCHFLDHEDNDMMRPYQVV